MIEVKRFMRYTIPGLSSVFVFLISCFFSPDIKKILCKIDVSENIIGVVFAGFLASGALGYILSNIFFSISWFPGLQKIFSLDHKPFLQGIENKIKLFKLEIGEEKEVEIEKIKQRDAWTIITREWFIRKDNPKVKSFENKNESLTDILHSIGTTLVGLIMSLVIWFFLFFVHIEKWNKECILSFILIILVFILLIIVFFFNFWRTKEASQALINSVMYEVFTDEYIKNRKRKIKIAFIP